MKTGVSTEPCAVASRPRRAAPSRANTSNPMLTGGLAYHYPLLPIFHSLAFVGALSLPEPLTLCLDVLHPRSIRAHHSVQTGHDGGQLVEQRGGRPCRLSTFRFIPSIAIIPAGRGPVPRTASTPPPAKRWSQR